HVRTWPVSERLSACGFDAGPLLFAKCHVGIIMHSAPAVQHVLQYISADVEAHAPSAFRRPTERNRHRCESSDRTSASLLIPESPHSTQVRAPFYCTFFSSPFRKVSCNGQVHGPSWTSGNREAAAHHRLRTAARAGVFSAPLRHTKAW